MIIFGMAPFKSLKYRKIKKICGNSEIVVIAIPAHYPFVISTCLEYATKCINAGQKVIIVNLSWLMPINFQNSLSRHVINFSFKPTVNSAIKNWCKYNNVLYLEPKAKKEIIGNKSVYNLECLNDIFMKTLRSMNSKSFGTRDFEISEIPNDEIISSKNSFLMVINYFDTLLDKYQFLKIDKIVTVNGRFLLDSAVVQFCKLKKLSYSVLESVTLDWNNYEEFHLGAHVTSEIRQLLINQWEKDLAIDPIKTRNLAIKHFEKRLSNQWEWNVGSSNEIFLASSRRKFVAYFPTSDWEFGVHDDDYEQQINKFNQLDTFKWTANYCKLHDLDLIVRVHPHPKNSRLAKIENNIWQENIAKYGGILIKSNDPISSHQVARKATANVVHKSSIGAELLYLGLPTVITSQTIYSFLTPEFQASTKESFDKIMKNMPNHNSKEKLLPWAYYFENGGTEFEYFKNIDNYTVLHDGKYFLEIRSWVQSILKFKKKLEEFFFKKNY